MVLSEYAQILEELGTTITQDSRFEEIPVYWDMVELIPDNMPTTAIVLQGKPFQLDATRCHYERQLDICIIHNTNYPREITLRLSNYSEAMKEVIDNFLMVSNLDLTFLQGSEIRSLRNNREDTESYKGTKTLFSSIIVLSYLLRY